jgi:ubiquinone/menaquinone biosynthesis C-methylase UbiE
LFLRFRWGFLLVNVFHEISRSCGGVLHQRAARLDISRQVLQQRMMMSGVKQQPGDRLRDFASGTGNELSKPLAALLSGLVF